MFPSFYPKSEQEEGKMKTKKKISNSEDNSELYYYE